MSYVEVFVVRADGDVVSYGEVRNNHCYGPLVWQVMAKERKLLSGDLPIILQGSALSALCKLFGTNALTREENILLGSTFDRVWIKKEVVPQLIEALKNFHTNHVIPNKWHPTIEGVAKKIEEMLDEFPDLMGVAFNQCSANSPFWQVPDHPAEGEWQGECRPYNVLKDKGNPGHDNQEAWELMNDLPPEEAPK